MATDPATLPGFVARFSVAGLVMGTGAADDAYVFGTGATWKDDSAAYTLSKLGNGFPQTTSRSGRRRLTQAWFSNAVDGRFYNLGLPTISTRNVGVAFIGQHSAGARGNGTPDASGTASGQALLAVGALAATDNMFGCGLDTTGRMANFRDAIASPISGTRVGCGTTSLIWGSGATGTYLKRLGFAGVTGGVYGTAAKTGGAIRLLHMDTDTQAYRWMGSDWDEILLYQADDAAMASYAATIEAWAVAQYGAVAPTLGTIIYLSTSRGEGYTGYGARNGAAFIQEALPNWDVINNSRAGYTIGNINTAAAALVSNANDVPLGTGKPVAFVLDGVSDNNINNGNNLATIQAEWALLMASIRTAYPRAPIAVLTTRVIGSTGAKEVVRLAERSWLLGGGLDSYGNVRVYDLGNAVAGMVPAGTADANVTAITNSPGTYFRLYNDAAPPTTNWDAVHYGIQGFDALQPYYAAYAPQIVASLMSGGGRTGRGRGDRRLMAIEG